MTGKPKKIRNTKQRKHMLNLLQSTDTHPNALWLFERMQHKFPSLSLSTVYRNLGILEQQGAIQRITCCSAFDRYDADTNEHSHFHCRVCNNVYDVDTVDIEKYALTRGECSGHHFEKCSVTFTGICKNCLQDEKSL